MSKPQRSHVQNAHPILIRGKIRHSKGEAFIVNIEPISFKDTLSYPQWIEAMHVEYKTIVSNNSWTLTDLPRHKKVVNESSKLKKI